MSFCNHLEQECVRCESMSLSVIEGASSVVADSVAPKKRCLSTKDDFPEHLRISASDLLEGLFLGGGSSSEVYRASWLGCKVVVKQLDMHRDFQFRTFKSHALKLEILMRLPQPHVVQLLGYPADARLVSIGMEFMETSLPEVTAHRKLTCVPPFAPYEAFDIVTKIALGMMFLHSRGITHGCLSSGIILMNLHPPCNIDVMIGGFAFSQYTNNPCVSLLSSSR